MPQPDRPRRPKGLSPLSVFDVSTPEAEREAEALLEFALGLSDIAPPGRQFGAVAPERLRGFLSRYLDSHGLEVVPDPKVMPQADPPARALGSLTPGTEKLAAGLAMPGDEKPAPTPAADAEARRVRAGLSPGAFKFASGIKLPPTP